MKHQVNSNSRVFDQYRLGKGIAAASTRCALAASGVRRKRPARFVITAGSARICPGVAGRGVLYARDTAGGQGRFGAARGRGPRLGLSVCCPLA